MIQDRITHHATRPVLTVDATKYSPSFQVSPGDEPNYMPTRGNCHSGYEAIWASVNVQLANAAERIAQTIAHLESAIKNWKPAAARVVASKGPIVHGATQYRMGANVGSTFTGPKCKRIRSYDVLKYTTSEVASEVTCKRCLAKVSK
jgi:hypothetical protein